MNAENTFYISSFYLFSTLSSSKPVLASKGLVKTASLHSPITTSAVVKMIKSPEIEDITSLSYMFPNHTHNMARDSGPIGFAQHNVEVSPLSRQCSNQGTDLKMLIIGHNLWG